MRLLRNYFVVASMYEEFDGLDLADSSYHVGGCRHNEHETFGGFLEARALVVGTLLLCSEHHCADLRRQPAGCKRSLRHMVGDGHGSGGDDRAVVLPGVAYGHKGGSAR